MAYYMMWVDEGNGISAPERLESQKEHRSWLKDGFWALVDTMAASRMIHLGSDGRSYVIVEDDAP
jgi:hypothetical protein